MEEGRGASPSGGSSLLQGRAPKLRQVAPSATVVSSSPFDVGTSQFQYPNPHDNVEREALQLAKRYSVKILHAALGIRLKELEKFHDLG